jgi:murein DD-endopeptidase MepM/ murein hydrolase activator NlpD
MATLAVFAMMAASGVDAADASTVSADAIGTASVEQRSPLVGPVAGSPDLIVAASTLDAAVIEAAPASTLPMVELIESLVAGMSAPAAPVRPAAPAWLCPISTPVRFADTYGEGRDGGRAHLGVDLTAPMGTPTVAPVSGSVRYSRDSAGGLSWHLDGDDGVYYYGTHLSKFGSVTGHVDQGTVIGYVGMTGNASMPHLHLEIHPGGIGKKSINPTPTAAKYCNNTL